MYACIKTQGMDTGGLVEHKAMSTIYFEIPPPHIFPGLARRIARVVGT